MKPCTKTVLPLLAVAALLTAPPVLAGTATLDPQMVEQGRYIARIAGCNDCHTPGYAMNDGNVDESGWLSGDNFGWRGPWGTTYGANLRLFVKDMTEDAWVEVARTLKRRPPMPWFNLNHMKENDLRALYQFIHSLGDPGQPAPAYVPPDQEPLPPYASFPAPPPAQ
ncbi:MAG: cytochrome C [Gammaproteobacteria bacterium]|jgi:mono/diheme cytochrome c family protein